MTCQDTDLNEMDKMKLLAEIVRLRQGIRRHRDQRMDDRCWMDDIALYELLPEGINPNFIDLRQLSKEEMMRNCDLFTTCRRLDVTPEQAVELYKKVK